MATFKQQRKCSIQEKFEEFHKLNPMVYKRFKAQVKTAIILGKTKISAKTILGYIRWEMDLSIQGDFYFKIDDAFTSRYARLFAKDHPDLEHLFNYRNLRS